MIRAINHLTLAPPTPGSPGWEDVTDLYRLLVELRLVVDRLSQACRHIGRHLGRPTAGHGGYEADSATEMGAPALVASACAAIDDAESHAAEAGRGLDTALCAVSHIRSNSATTAE